MMIVVPFAALLKTDSKYEWRAIMWPNNSRAAVSFTYDDGHESGIDIAAVDLEEKGYRGTFFITPGRYNVAQRAADWQRLMAAGHEIGNHTMTHPCSALSTMSVDQLIANETGAAEHWLNENVGSDRDRTYAYICGETQLGPEPGARDRYFDLVRKTFLAARAGGGGPTSAIEALQMPVAIPAQALTYGNDSADSTIEYLNRALEIQNGWAVLIFHDITPESAKQERETSREVHRQIVNYVSSHTDLFWVAPFREVYRQAANIK